MHADDASGILARSNGLSSQDKELCKEPFAADTFSFDPVHLLILIAFPKFWAVGGLITLAPAALLGFISFIFM